MLKWLHLVFTCTGCIQYASRRPKSHAIFALLSIFSSLLITSSFTSSTITFHFFAVISFLLAIALFWLFIFIRWCTGFSRGEKEAIQLHTVVCAWTEQQMHSEQLPTELRKLMWFVTDHHILLLSMQWLVDWSKPWIWRSHC